MEELLAVMNNAGQSTGAAPATSGTATPATAATTPTARVPSMPVGTPPNAAAVAAAAAAQAAATNAAGTEVRRRQVAAQTQARRAQATARARGGAAQRSVPPSADAKANLNELMSLVGSGASPAQPAAGIGVGGQVPNAAAVAAAAAAAAVTSSAAPSRTGAAGNRAVANPSAPKAGDITAELEGVLAASGPTGRPSVPIGGAGLRASLPGTAGANAPGGGPRSTAGRPTSAAAAAATAHAARVRQGAAGRDGRPQVTQEQVVVGHFCRHAIKTLLRVMEGQPNKQEKEAEIRAVIKELWTQWVRGVIPKTALLERVSEFVRSSTPAARDINVTGEFRNWYQQQLTLHASMSGNRATAAPAAASAQQRPASVSESTGALASRASGIQAAAAAAAKASQPKNPAVTAAAGGVGFRGTTGGTAVANRTSSVVSAAVASMPTTAIGKPARTSSAAPAGTQRPRPASVAAASGGASAIASPPSTYLAAAAASAAAAPAASASPSAPQAIKKPRAQSKGKKQNAKSAAAAKASEAGAKQKLQPSVGTSGQTPGGSSQPAAAAAEPSKKGPRKVDDELDIVRDIVDIEGEEKMMVSSATVAASGADPSEYDNAGMILVGPILRSKLEAAARRTGLDQAVPPETMEIVALAARERLAFLLDEVSDIAKARSGANFSGWKTQPHGPNMRLRMQQQRDQEQRYLDAGAEVRREKAAKAAAKVAETAADADKSVKEAAASADAKKKEQALKEKQQMAQKTQRNALRDIMGGIAKKKTRKDSHGTKGGLKASVSKGSLSGVTSGKSSGAKRSASASGLAGSGGSSKRMGSTGNMGATDNMPQTPEGGTRVTEGREAGTPTPMEGVSVPSGATVGKVTSGPTTKPQRPPILLRDCLHFMEGEPRTRKGSLLYMWYSRVGLDKQPHSRAGGRK